MSDLLGSNSVLNPELGPRLNSYLEQAGLPQLDEETLRKFGLYFDLLMRWNARTNMTGIRDADGILRRHFVESIATACAVPPGVQTLLDFGSGAGFPGIPIALCRPDIAVTLAESNGKKAAFLHEAVRTLEIQTVVFHGRGESLQGTFGAVTLRAVEKMREAVPAAVRLIGPLGFLMLMTTEADVADLEVAAGATIKWQASKPLAAGESRLLQIGRRVAQT
jgi:16S rRNA (guanine527-N7)-methyltransferase